MHLSASAHGQQLTEPYTTKLPVFVVCLLQQRGPDGQSELVHELSLKVKSFTELLIDAELRFKIII